MFSAYVTTSGQAWADFDIYMPGRRAQDTGRRHAAGIPDGLQAAAKPQLAIAQVRRLAAAGLPARWAAFDEVYGRSGKLREACQRAGLAYVAIIPCDFQLTTPARTVIRADQAAADAVFERRSAGTGTKGPRISDRAMIATASPRHFLLIRRLLSRPDQLTFYLCYAPPGTPATMTYFITIAGRRWPAEETFKTGKDVPGWDQRQARTWDALRRHTALSALAQLRGTAIRNALCGAIQPGTAAPDADGAGFRSSDAGGITDADLQIPLGDAPVPARAGQRRPRRIGLIKLSVAETARLTRLAADHAAGLISLARLAFALRWSARRRRHQAIARWHHHSARLLAAAT